MNGEIISIETAKIMKAIEKENKELQEENEELQQRIDTSIAENMILIKENNKMQQKIYKAIEYIEEKYITFFDNVNPLILLDKEDFNKILNILKGEDK